MKKLVLAAIMMLVPFSAFALDAMNDDAMDKLTGQAGVTITFENVVITQSSADMGWTDADGCDRGGDNTGSGTVYLDYTDGATETTITGSLSIDVATATTQYDILGTTADIASGTTFVKIGLPSVSQTAVDKTMTIGLAPTVAIAKTDAIQVLGQLYQAGGSSSISANSAIYIYAH